MPDYQVTFLINEETQGISESYYKTAGSVEAIRLAALALANARTYCLVDGVSFEAVRISDIAIIGDSLVTTGTRAFTKIDSLGDLAGSGIQIRLNSGTLYRRSLVLRGVPDAWIIRNDLGQRVFTGTARQAVADYIKFLVDNNWALKVTQKLAENAGTALTDVTAVAGKDKLTKISSGIGGVDVPPGTRIQIRGCRNTARVLNGYWTTVGASEVGLVTIGLASGRVLGYNPSDIQKGIVRKVITQLATITSGDAIQVAYRKPGRAFFVPAGRARNRPH